MKKNNKNNVDQRLNKNLKRTFNLMGMSSFNKDIVGRIAVSNVKRHMEKETMLCSNDEIKKCVRDNMNAINEVKKDFTFSKIACSK